MSNFTTNITPDAIKEQLEKENNSKKPMTQFAFDVKNYLNVRLSPSETSKTLTIRLLPSSEQSNTPFEKVYMHTVKVSKEVSDSGWKTLPCPTHNHSNLSEGESCPFCDLAEQAKKMMFASTNESEKTKYREISNLNRAREMWVVRCIERGHEEDGVKFWLMPNSKDGAYAKIMGVWNNRWNKAQEKGQVNNIFDLNNGKDLDITITKSSDGKNVISVVDADEKSPLTDDYEKGMSWIKDSKKWSDVYKVKPYEYMEILCNCGVPVYSKEKGCYVDKEAEKEEKEERAQADAETNYTAQPIDYTVIVPQSNSNEGNNESVEDLPF